MIESYTTTESINRAADNAARSFCMCRQCDRARRDAWWKQQEADERSAAANRLVKAAKSPTDRFPGATGAYFNRQPLRSNPPKRELMAVSPGFAKDLKQPGTWTVVEKRPWSGEYRIRFETRPGAAVSMPDNSGDRITAMLTERGARKISESCYFMACQRGGFSTFATLTLTPEAREKLGRRVIVPMYPRNKKGFPVIPAEPARAKQGRIGVKYQVGEETPVYNVAEINTKPWEIRHPESGALYTPMKIGWAWSVQKEAGRFFEAANKMYQRGWQYRRFVADGKVKRDDESGSFYQPIKRITVKVPGSRALYCVEGKEVTKKDQAEYTKLKWWREPLAYLWVAENPDRIDEETGEVTGQNPHLHVLMKWRVDHRHFRAWASRLEKLWGHGTYHLEKIKDPQKAGSYVAKAAGYLCKAQGKSDQGEIRGNRYGISARARAPGWIELERHQVGLMGWLMAEAHEMWNNQHGPKIQRREKLKRSLEAESDQSKRQKIGKMLEAVRAEIEPLQRASKYGVLFKTVEQKDKFIRWAKRMGWSEQPQHSLWLVEWRKLQWKRRHGTRLTIGIESIKAWFAMADSGAVACNDEEREAMFS